MADPALLPGAHKVPTPHHVAVAALQAGSNKEWLVPGFSAEVLGTPDIPSPSSQNAMTSEPLPQTPTTCRRERQNPSPQTQSTTELEFLEATGRFWKEKRERAQEERREKGGNIAREGEIGKEKRRKDELEKEEEKNRAGASGGK